MQYSDTFPALVRLYRKQKGYTQAEAAAALGYSRDTIAAWECGRRLPVTTDIPRLASLLEVETAKLAQIINEPRLESYRQKIYTETAAESTEKLTIQSTNDDLTIAHPSQASAFLEIQMQASHTNSALFAASQVEAATLDPLHVLPQELQTMSSISRHQLLELGIATLIIRLAQLDSKRISAVEREELGRALGESIADGWNLFHTAGNAEVLKVGQVQLSLIHQAHTLLFPSTRPYLYAGTYGLLGLALHFQNRHEEALYIYHGAHLAALATGDPWYIAENLIDQADTYLVLGRYAEALQILEEAFSYLGDTDEEHRRAKAHLLGCWADVAMTIGDHTLAEKKLDASAEYLDHANIKEEFDRICWLQFAGKRAIMAGNYAQAVTYLEEALNANPPHWLVRHTGILTLLAIAYARMGEREQSLLIAQRIMPVLGTVNAPMTNNYFLEYLRQDIVNLFPFDSKVQTFLSDMRQQLPHLDSFIDALK